MTNILFLKSRRNGGVKEKSSLYALVKMLIIMDNLEVVCSHKLGITFILIIAPSLSRTFTEDL